MSGPWAVDATAFPAKGAPRAQLEYLLHYAVLAPSTHNTQPWLFQYRGDALELFMDRDRRLPVADPDDRELVISCGAALAFLQVAARHFGYEGEIGLGDMHNPDLLARFRLGKTGYRDPANERRFAAIPHRRTVRMAFSDQVPPRDRLDAMRLDAAEQGVELCLVTDEVQKRRLAALVAQADREQMANPAFRAELAKWIRPADSASGDGMSLHAMGGLDILSPAAALILRTFDMGGGMAARDAQLAKGSPVLAIMATSGDGKEDWLRTGMALADLLLDATVGGLGTAFLNQPVELPSYRTQLLQWGVKGVPQLLVRLGYGPDVPPSARREVRQIICG